MTQIADVAGMKEVEHAVREDDDPAGSAAPGHEANGLVESHTSVLKRTLGENVQVCLGR